MWLGGGFRAECYGFAMPHFNCEFEIYWKSISWRNLFCSSISNCTLSGFANDCGGPVWYLSWIEAQQSMTQNHCCCPMAAPECFLQAQDLASQTTDIHTSTAPTHTDMTTQPCPCKVPPWACRIRVPQTNKVLFSHQQSVTQSCQSKVPLQTKQAMEPCPSKVPPQTL